MIIKSKTILVAFLMYQKTVKAGIGINNFSINQGCSMEVLKWMGVLSETNQVAALVFLLHKKPIEPT